jgi:hypothetical protein
VIGTENVRRQEVRLILISMMVFMKMVVIPKFLGELIFKRFSGGYYVCHAL